MSITLKEKQKTFLLLALTIYEKYVKALSNTPHSLNKNMECILSVKQKIEKNESNFTKDNSFYITLALDATNSEYRQSPFETALMFKMAPNEFEKIYNELYDLFDA